MTNFYIFGKMETIFISLFQFYKAKKSVFLILSFFLFLSSKTQAAIINVPADFATIQAAVNAAAAGDVIMVADGTYNESVNLATGPAGITVQAVNVGGATVNGGVASAFIAAGHTGNITISGLAITSTLNNSTAGVIYITNLTGQLTVDNCAISATDTNGVALVNSGAMPTNVSIFNNPFGNFGNDDPIYIFAGATGTGGDANILIDGNTNTGFLQDDAIHIEIEGSNTNNTVVITDNNFGNWTGTGGGIELLIGGSSAVPTNQEVHYIIEGNTFGNADGDVIVVLIDGMNSNSFGIISNNVINSAGAGDDGIYINSESSALGLTANLLIENNMISNVLDDGINIRAISSSVGLQTWNVVINNNTIDNPNGDSTTGFTEAGINIRGLGTLENYIINVEVTNNTISNLNGVTSCIRIDEPGTGIATPDINYELSNNTGCPTPNILGNPDPVTDPVPSSLDLLNIGNLVWNDLNGDGIKDGAESGVGNVQINYTGNGFSGSTYTDAMGNYTLPALTPGTYTLTIIPPADFPNVSPTGNDSVFDPVTFMATVTLTAGGTDDLTIDAGLSNSVAAVFTGINDFVPTDPCSCNDDQGANGSQSGTFAETVSVTGDPGDIVTGQIWTVTAIAPLAGATMPTLPGGGAIVVNTTTLTFDGSGATNRYFLDLAHTDDGGYNISIEGPAAVGDAGNTTVMISNLCEYPEISAITGVNASYLETDGSVTSTAVTEISTPTNTGTTVLTISPALPSGFTDNGDGTFTIDPATGDAGSYTVTATFTPTAPFTNTGGTAAAPGYPGDVCETEETFMFTVTGACTADNGVLSITN